MKFLGVLIDENLSWKCHINTVKNKIAKHLGLLQSTIHCQQQLLKTAIFFLYSQLYVSYANISWGSTHKSKFSQLHRLQKHAARTIYFKDKMTHATPLLQQLNALNVYQLNILQTLNFVFKLQQNLVPNTFHQLFTKRINKYSLRSDNYTEPRKKTKLTQFAISYRGPHLWNVILKDQVEIKKLTSPNSFKYKVKDLLLSIDLDNLLNFFLKKQIYFYFFQL